MQGEPLELPLTSAAISKVTGEAMKTEGMPIYKLSGEKMRTTNPGWKGCLEQGVKAGLALLTKQGVNFECKNIEMVALTGGASLPIDLHRISENHVATALVVLPSYDACELSIEARHGHLTSSEKVKKDDPFATHFIAMYSGMESSTLTVANGPACCLIYNVFSEDDNSPSLRNLTGPREEISKAFAAWKLALGHEDKPSSLPRHILYQLNGKYSPKKGLKVSHIDHPTDKLVLGHLAPPAKHYGFTIILARVCAHVVSSISLENGSDDGDEYDDYTADDINMSNGDTDIYEVDWYFASLSGKRIEAGQAMEDSLSADMEGKRNILNRRIDLGNEEGKQPDLDRDGDRDETYLRVNYEKRASLLLIVPQERVFMGLRDPSPPKANPESATGPTPRQPTKEQRTLGAAGGKRKRAW